MGGKSHVSIPGDEVTVGIRNWFPVDFGIFDTYWQDRAIYIERDLEE